MELFGRVDDDPKYDHTKQPCWASGRCHEVRLKVDATMPGDTPSC